MSKPKFTIVPALPGHIALRVLDNTKPGNVDVRITREPIIAWRVPHDGYGQPVPVTPISSVRKAINIEWATLLDDGRVVDSCGVIYDDQRYFEEEMLELAAADQGLRTAAE